MTVNCPFCGSSKIEKTFNFNESTCTLCKCDFKVLDGGRIRVFNEGSWKKYCESMAEHVSNNISKSEIVNLVTRVFKEHSHSPKDIDILLNHIITIAENINYEMKSGLRDKYDFVEMIKIAESVDRTYKILYERREDLGIEDMQEYDMSGSGYDIQDFPGEVQDMEDMEDDIDDDDVPNIMLGDDKLEEDHLDSDFDIVKNDLRDLSNKTFNISTDKDVWELRTKISDLQKAVDDLYSEYKDGYIEDGEEDIDLGLDDEDGEEDIDLGLDDEDSEEDIDLGLDDEDSEEDIDLGLDDEESEDGEEDIDLGLDDEESEDGEEDTGLVTGIEVASHQRIGNKLQEAKKKPSELHKKMKSTNKNFNKVKESPGVYLSNKGIGVQKSQKDFEDNIEVGQDIDGVPFVQGDEVESENQFGDDKLSSGIGAVKSTPTIEDFTLKGKPSGKGLGIRREEFEGYRVGDKVFISESRDEWEIVSINKSKATVKRKNTVTKIDLLSENVEHADKNLKSHRERDLLSESKRKWELLQKKILKEGEACVGGVCGLSGPATPSSSTLVSPMTVSSVGSFFSSPTSTKQVADKTHIYKYIKDNGLHVKPREVAYDQLISIFNNPEQEINQILDDAILSNDQTQTDTIDSMYHYESSNLRQYEIERNISEAYKKMSKLNSREVKKIIKENAVPRTPISRREDQNNDPIIENLGRSWINRVSEGLEEI
jgi:transcription initiation factor TFIIIB Brf1 subunit/transcription initiation factor TFIIB